MKARPSDEKKSSVAYGTLALLTLMLLFLSACGPTATLPLATSGTATIPLLTPTPLFDLPGGDVIQATAESAGTATRIAQLTYVPTWPPDQPFPTMTVASSPPHPAIPTHIAGDGIIYDTDLVSIGLGLDLPSNLGLFANEWVTYANGQHIQVLAGSSSAPSESSRMQGLIAVQMYTADDKPLGLPDVYETPVRGGSVRIVDAVGQRLTLASENGTFFYFDLPTRAWVNFGTPGPTGVPTYVGYAQSVQATARTIAQTLPTATPLPGLPPDAQQDKQWGDLWNRAMRTAVVLDPPPTNYDPGAEMSHVPPQPTEEPPPHQATASGTIYNASSEDDPIGNKIHTLNYWHGWVNNAEIMVYAGYAKEKGHETQGVIVIHTQPQGTPGTTYQTDLYQTPVQEGGVRITGEVDGRLTLQIANEARFYFDLPTRTWVNPGTPGPTSVPTP